MANLMQIEEIPVEGFEKVLEARDPATGMHCFIAIHNTSLGPTLGGLRIYPYENRNSALSDVLRLAKGMTYKAAISKSGLGGGKSVLIADQGKKTKELLHAYGKVIDTLNGLYITAEDIGSTPDDMASIKEVTPYVSCLADEFSTGDPSRFTARGVFLGIQAVAHQLFGTRKLKDVRVAVQGLGSVGMKLADLLFWEGAQLILTDINHEKLHTYSHYYGAEIIAPKDFITVSCDILSPCAMGGILNAHSIPNLRCKGIAGAANNQLSEDTDGKRIMEQGILYAPDYVINAGGLMNAVSEFDKGGYHPKTVRNRVEHIYDVLIEIFNQASEQNMPTNDIADQIALYNIKNNIGKREAPIFNENSA